jgi:hypothetical protein
LKYIAGPLKIVTTVLMILLAVSFVQLIVYQIGIALTHQSEVPESKQAKSTEWKIARAAKQFMPDGTVHLISRQKGRRVHKDYRQEQIFDANHNLLWSGFGKDQPFEYLSWAAASDTFVKQRRMRRLQGISPEFSRMLEVPVSSEKKTEEIWRYDHDLNLFIGYEIAGNRIGYIGTTGFTESQDQAKAFEHFRLFTAWVPLDSFSPTVLWQTNRNIYEINFEKQKVDVLFESPEVDIKQLKMYHWKLLPADNSKPKQIKYRPLIYCPSADGKHHLIMRNPQQKITAAVPEDWPADSVQFTATNDGIFMLYKGKDTEPPKGAPKFSRQWRQWRKLYNSRPSRNWTELYRLSSNGAIELVNRFEWTRPALAKQELIDPRERIMAMVTKISPPAYDLLCYLFEEKLKHHARRDSGMSSLYAHIVRAFRPGNSVVNVVLSILLMCIALWHGWTRRTGWIKLSFWVMLTGAFNVAGLLVYLGINHKAVIKCPACSNKRGLEQNRCIRCDADLPKAKPRVVDLLSSTN